MAAEQARNLSLDGLRQKRARAVAQNLGQRIGKSSWLRELENISVGHGVSLLCWRSGGLEHPHDTPPYPFTPSPTFAHSSRPKPAMGCSCRIPHACSWDLQCIIVHLARAFCSGPLQGTVQSKWRF